MGDDDYNPGYNPGYNPDREEVLRNWNIGCHTSAYKTLVQRGDDKRGGTSLDKKEKENDIRVARKMAEGGGTWEECRDGYLGIIEEVKELMRRKGER